MVIETLSVENFGRRIKQERRARGWSKNQLADKADVSPSVLSDWEAGRHTPNVYTACMVARALGISVDYLCGRTEIKGVAR